MDVFEFLFGSVLVVMVAAVLITIIQARHRHRPAADDAEALRLREQVRTLADRVAVLERVVTDKEITLEREIERLRDR
jgi:hypothetical protein